MGFPEEKPNLKTDYVDDTDDVIEGMINEPNGEINALADKVGIDDSADPNSLDSIIRTGWNPLTAVVPTRASADDPTYVLTFAGVDLTDRATEGCPVKFTQNGATVFGWISKDSTFSTNTTVTLYCGTDYDVLDTAIYPITSFRVGLPKQPGIGFPVNPDKWTVEVTDTTTRDKEYPTNNTIYYSDLGSIHLSVPVGSWNISLSLNLFRVSTSNVVSAEACLSTSNTSISDNELRERLKLHYSGPTNAQLQMSMFMKKNILLSSKTTYYVIAIPREGNDGRITLRNEEQTLVVRAVCNYL